MLSRLTIPLPIFFPIVLMRAEDLCSIACTFFPFVLSWSMEPDRFPSPNGASLPTAGVAGVTVTCGTGPVLCTLPLPTYSCFSATGESVLPASEGCVTAYSEVRRVSTDTLAVSIEERPAQVH